jgi:glycosyltransferase involved in cell wall biosynthesis
MNILRARPPITLDIGPLMEAQWTGISVFTRRLVTALLRHEGLDLSFSFRLTCIPTSEVLTAIRAGTGTLLRERFESDAVHRGQPVDPNVGLLYPSVKEAYGVLPREASCVHDMSTLVMPEFHEDANVAYHLDHLSEELASDHRVFAISEATRAALIAAFPSVADKVRLLHQYVDWPDHFAMLERNLPGPALGPYAVVVGTVEPRKNLGLLLKSLDRPELRRSRLRFVVIGRRGWKVDAFLANLPPEAQERVIFSGFVSEFSKYRLMRHARFLVYPSMYEGFGIPALEAMSLGKPVLSSFTSSLPEVVQDAGVYFDPLSVDEFAAAFSEINHPDKLAELAQRAIEATKVFSWKRMAAPVVEWVGETAPVPERSAG